jgi:hypothetical protein
MFNRKFSSKNVLSKIYYSCKIISSKTGLKQKFSSNFFFENFLLLQNHFFENWFEPKIFIKQFLVENFLWLQNHFLENSFETKIS